MKRIITLMLLIVCCVSPAFAASEKVIDGLLHDKIYDIFSKNKDKLKEAAVVEYDDDLRKEVIYQAPGKLFRTSEFFNMLGGEENWDWNYEIVEYITTDFDGLIKGIKPGMSPQSIDKVLSGLRGQRSDLNDPEVVYFGDSSGLLFFYENKKAFCLQYFIIREEFMNGEYEEVEKQITEKLNKLRKSTFGTSY